MREGDVYISDVYVRDTKKRERLRHSSTEVRRKKTGVVGRTEYMKRIPQAGAMSMCLLQFAIHLEATPSLDTMSTASEAGESNWNNDDEMGR